jgi:hypothetical protein
MIEFNTEFGRFKVTTVGVINVITFEAYDDPTVIDLGWIHMPMLDSNSESAMYVCLSKYANVLMTLMRYEAKCGLFLSIPLTNPFRDALLRMQIENTGQTLAVRNYIEAYNSTHTWTTYPKECETFVLDDAYVLDKIVLLTPYGAYKINQIDTYSYEVIQVKDNTEKVLGLIRVPYNEIDMELDLAAYIQMIDIMMADTMDTIWKKTHETTKRTAEAIKYMFNYDKLRRALRKKGIQ